MKRPHFVCIGAQKAGTQWLYDQAASHPGVWMPPIKEVKFLTGRWGKTRQEAHKKLHTMIRRIISGEEVRTDDLDFLRIICWRTEDGSPGDFQLYRRLFSPAGSRITGDISPQYARLSAEDVQRVLRELPWVKFLFLVREPVSRLWSQACMMLRWEVAPDGLLSDERVFRDWLDVDGVRELSFQSQTIELWRAHADESRFRTYLMDDMIADPESFRNAIFEFIGLDPAGCTIPAGHNKKSGNAKVEMPPAYRPIIEDYLGDEPMRLSALIGGRAREWKTAAAA